MNTFDSSPTSPTGPNNGGQAKENGSSLSRSPTHADSAMSSSAGSSRSRSSRKYSRSPQTQQQPSNESTTLFDAADSSTRNYQATEASAPSYGQSDQAKNRPTDPSAPSNGSSHVNGNTDTQNRLPQSPEEPKQSWKSRFVDRYGSLELENKGSVARDHLALERTFLAWMRTSLAFASIGIAVTQLFRLNNAGASTHTNTIHSLNAPPSIHPHYSYASTSSSQDTSRLRSMGKPLGSTFIGVAMLILVVGFHRYFESQYWIVRGKFPASRGSVALTAFVAAALIVATFAVILAVSPGAIER